MLKITLNIFISIIISFLIIFIPLIYVYFFYQTHFFPHTYIILNGKKIKTSNLIYEEAFTLCQKEKLNQMITFKFNNQMISSSSDQLKISFNCQKELFNYFIEKRSLSFYHELVNILFNQNEKLIPITLKIDEIELNIILEQINQRIYQKPKKTKFILNNNQIFLEQGIDGQNLKKEKSLDIIKQNLNNNQFDIQLNISTKKETIDDQEKGKFLAESNKLLKYEIVFNHPTNKNYQLILNNNQLLSLYNPFEDLNQESFNKIATASALAVKIDGNNAIFEFDQNNQKIINFKPEKKSILLDQNNLERILILFFKNFKKTDNIIKDHLKIEYELPLIIKNPDITLEKLNNLGIKEVIGSGESFFYHSTANRVFNVNLAASKINLTLIQPKEEFSFNKTIGEISKRTGFKQALIIQNGSTVLGDGGGVCQVSTTLFRTVLDAGLAVTKRVNHAYRVSYYEYESKIGMDATVYSGDVDLRFINDTLNPILIYTQSDPANYYLKIILFGTRDGRKTEIINYKTYNYSSPPPAVYIINPDQPISYLKQTEKSIPGITSTFTNVIKDQNDQIIREDKYISIYKSWGARFIQGSKP